MNPTVIGNLEWLDILTALVAATAPWNGAIMHLFKNNFSPTPGSLLADFTEGDFTGYAASTAIVWGTPGFLPDGTAIVIGGSKVFTVGATPTIFNTIYGYYLTNAGGTVLLFARKFDAPIVLSAAGQIIDVLPAYPTYRSP